MGLDEARHSDVSELLAKHGRPRHLGAELGGSEA